MKKFLRMFILLLIVSFGIWFWWKFYFTYSEGNRSGLMQKFTLKGNVFKTYEGELVMSSVIMANPNTPIASEKFFFSVEDEELGKKLLGLEGNRVILHYKMKNGVLPWRGETPYIVDSMRIMK